MARTPIMLACIALAVAPATASADCASYRQWRGDSTEGWNRWLSFTACTQDASVGEVVEPDQLPTLVEDLQASLVPTLERYLVAVERGPSPVKLRAGFHMAMTQVVLITRARSSIKVRGLRTDPRAAARFEQLHAALEPLLEEPALLAWTLLVAIDRNVTETPSLVRDPVTRNLARMAREIAIQLGESWSFPRETEPPLRASRSAGAARVL